MAGAMAALLAVAPASLADATWSSSTPFKAGGAGGDCDELGVRVLLNGGNWPGHAPYFDTQTPPVVMLPRPSPDAHEVAAGRAMAVLYPAEQWMPGALHLANGTAIDAHQLRALWTAWRTKHQLRAVGAERAPDAGGTDSCDLGVIMYYVPYPEFFAYPPVRHGHAVTVHVDSGTRALQLVTAAFAPAVFTVDDLLTEEEVEYLTSTSDDYITEQLMVGAAGTLKNYRRRRVRGGYVTAKDDAVIKRVQARVGELLRVNVRASPHLAEHMYMVSYGVGDKFEQHQDYYNTDANEAGRADDIARDPALAARPVAVWGRNRFATAILYLNDVPKKWGGATNFPRAAGMNEFKFKPCTVPTFDCSCGLNVQPKAGAAVIFYNLEVAGHEAPLAWGGARVDPMSIHVGCALKNGSKLVANQWLHSWYGDVPPAGLRQNQKLVQTARRFNLPSSATPLASHGGKSIARIVSLAEAPLGAGDDLHVDGASSRPPTADIPESGYPSTAPMSSYASNHAGGRDGHVDDTRRQASSWFGGWI